ncbi:nitrilase-related carbon-nitrogen hydrolase [Streptomyces sp. NPDC046685]|uniref:nitrilase-related carbon-nitrogen hydrolase n=1 Tax=Streptomyces sp. NPDC046685 TaxID=3157202 RepID=UPI0033C6D369
MKIAAAQLTCVPADVEANAAQAAALAVRARERGAGLVVFPELALTGYELDALAADPGLMTPADDPGWIRCAPPASPRPSTSPCRPATGGPPSRRWSTTRTGRT